MQASYFVKLFVLLGIKIAKFSLCSVFYDNSFLEWAEGGAPVVCLHRCTAETSAAFQDSLAALRPAALLWSWSPSDPLDLLPWLPVCRIQCLLHFLPRLGEIPTPTASWETFCIREVGFESLHTQKGVIPPSYLIGSLVDYSWPSDFEAFAPALWLTEPLLRRQMLFSALSFTRG